MDLALEMQDICKSFPGVNALNNVSLAVARGEVHALVGENGAGKSTLIKILSGAYSRDSGVIRIGGQPVTAASPRRMLELGVAVIYQEMALAPRLSVAENIFLGRLPRTRLGCVDWQRLGRDTGAVSEQLGLSLQPWAYVGSLNVAQRQMVEIAKALSRDARLIVLDEPSAVLGDNELKGLFEVIRHLTGNGVSFIYISHRLSEVFRIADRVTVLKDGQLVGTDQVENLDPQRLVKMMVGRELSDIYPRRTPRLGPEAVRVTGLSRGNMLRGINLTVRQGEIVGIAGLAGSGRTELLRAVAGVDPIDAGRIEILGRSVLVRSPRQAISLGMGILPEDRKVQGLFLKQSVSFNVTISRLAPVLYGGLLRLGSERRLVTDYVHKLNIRTPSVATRVQNLSGGNQQKCVFAKWLNADCRILLVDEPTRGVDVGAKREIYQLLADLADSGAAIVMVSSELPEVLGLSDRILVMREGSIVGELERAAATEEAIMQRATGEAS